MGNTSFKQEATRLRKENSRLSSHLQVCKVQNGMCKKKHDETMDVLKSILPEKIALDIVENRTVPTVQKKVGVIFADLVGWTSLCERVPAKLLICWMDCVYSHIDTLIEKHGIVKIKCIGDCIMACSAGALLDHEIAKNVQRQLPPLLDFALELQEFISTVKLPDKSGRYAQFRMGIHFGECITGIIGRKVPHFDVFGATVNLAARMEQSGVSGHIQVSHGVYQAMKHLFCFEPRGIIRVKGVDRPIRTYFVKHRQCRGQHHRHSSRKSSLSMDLNDTLMVERVRSELFREPTLQM